KAAKASLSSSGDLKRLNTRRDSTSPSSFQRRKNSVAICASRVLRASLTCCAAKAAAPKAPTSPSAKIDVAMAVTSLQSAAMVAKPRLQALSGCRARAAIYATAREPAVSPTHGNRDAASLTSPTRSGPNPRAAGKSWASAGRPRMDAIEQLLARLRTDADYPAAAERIPSLSERPIGEERAHR